MIRPLRSRHRAIWLVLVLVVPAIFAAGLAVRRPPPIVDTPLPGTMDAVGESPTTIQNANLPDGRNVSVHWFASESDALHRIRVELSNVQSSPEILVYWAPGTGSSVEALPEASRLLGVVRGRSTDLLQVPQESTPADPGHLVLYSLSQGLVVGEVDLRPPGSGAAA